MYHEEMLEDTGDHRSHPPLGTLISLPLTCRQLCHETAVLPFVTNTFIVHLCDLNSFVDTLPKVGREALKSLHLNAAHYIALDYMCPDDWVPWFARFTRLESLDAVVVAYFGGDGVVPSKNVLVDMRQRILTCGGKDVEVHGCRV